MRWSRLYVLLFAGRLLLDVGTPLLPGAFQFEGDQSAESRLARAHRVAAPLAPRPPRPIPEAELVLSAVVRIGGPRPSTAARPAGAMNPRRQSGREPEPAPSSDDH